MAAVFAAAERVRAEMGAYRDRVAIAAINGPESVVVSGAVDAVRALCGQLGERGVRSTPLRVSHAFHSPLMEPMAPAFEEVVGGLRYGAPRLRLISNVTGQPLRAREIDAAYWVQHVRAPVQFRRGWRRCRPRGGRCLWRWGRTRCCWGWGSSVGRRGLAFGWPRCARGGRPGRRCSPRWGSCTCTGCRWTGRGWMELPAARSPCPRIRSSGVSIAWVVSPLLAL